MKAGKGQSKCQSGLNNGKQNVKKGPIKSGLKMINQTLTRGSILSKGVHSVHPTTAWVAKYCGIQL